MKHIIFAGGSGTRFWPASRRNSPKQFQSIIEDKPLIRVKFEYLKLGFKPEDIFISTGIKYKKEVESILPEIPKENFIFEPDMRDTGPAVALAVAYVNKIYPGEVISTQWADHYIKYPEIFINALKEGEKIVSRDNKSVIVGVPPRFPSPHVGHIKFGKKIESLEYEGRISLNNFVRFVEKPSIEVAKQYIESGDYSWNTGYLITKPELIFNKYKKYSPEIFDVVNEICDNEFDNQSLSKFSKLEKVSFEYIFSENLTPEETYTLNADMGWSDVGTWIALRETLADHDGEVITQGNVEDIGSKGSLVYNYEPKELVATMNLEDMIVINTKDVVAIFHKDDNGKIKEFLKRLEDKNKTEFL